MGVLSSKSKLGEAADAIDLGRMLRTAARSSLESALAQDGAGAKVAEAAGKAKPVSRAAKPALIVAGGIAGVTAASAAVSAVRRTQEDA